MDGLAIFSCKSKGVSTRNELGNINHIGALGQFVLATLPVMSILLCIPLGYLSIVTFARCMTDLTTYRTWTATHLPADIPDTLTLAYQNLNVNPLRQAQTTVIHGH